MTTPKTEPTGNGTMNKKQKLLAVIGSAAVIFGASILVTRAEVKSGA